MGSILAPAAARKGGRKALLIPWEKAPWQAEKRGCLYLALPLSHGTPYPKSARQALCPSILPTPPGAWVRIPAGPIGKGRETGFFLFRLWLFHDL